MENKQKKGISLIVLVITIIVMIILATAIILSLNSSGIIGKANKAKEDTDISTIREVASIASSEYELEKVDGTTTKTKKEYVEEYLNSQNLELPEGYIVNDEGQIEAANSISVWDGTIATSFASGTGTEADPYIIETAAQFAYFATFTNASPDNTNGKYFKLVSDIDLNNIEWIIIGSKKDSSAGDFAGVFDGQNHKVYNVNVTEDSEYSATYVGIFGVSVGEIRNLILESGSVRISAYKQGGICGMNSGSIINCVNKATIYGVESYMVGGICGENNGLIKQCMNQGSVSGDSNTYSVGEIYGFNNGTIE